MRWIIRTIVNIISIMFEILCLWGAYSVTHLYDSVWCAYLLVSLFPPILVCCLAFSSFHSISSFWSCVCLSAGREVHNLHYAATSQFPICGQLWSSFYYLVCRNGYRSFPLLLLDHFNALLRFQVASWLHWCLSFQFHICYNHFTSVNQL